MSDKLVVFCEPNSQMYKRPNFVSLGDEKVGIRHGIKRLAEAIVNVP